MISASLRKTFTESSTDWCDEAKAFSLLLSSMEQLEDRLKRLEDKLSVNSGNSSNPPSKDDFKPPKKRSLRR